MHPDATGGIMPKIFQKRMISSVVTKKSCQKLSIVKIAACASRNLRTSKLWIPWYSVSPDASSPDPMFPTLVFQDAGNGIVRHLETAVLLTYLVEADGYGIPLAGCR